MANELKEHLQALRAKVESGSDHSAVTAADLDTALSMLDEGKTDQQKSAKTKD